MPMRRVLPPPKPQPAKKGPLIVGVLVVVLVLGGGYGLYQTLLKPSALPPSGKGGIIIDQSLHYPPLAVSSPAPVVTPPPTPPAQPAAVPAQPTDTTIAAIDAHTKTAVEPVNEVLAGQTPAASTPSPGAVTTPAPAAPPTPVAAPNEATASSAAPSPTTAPAASASQALRIDLPPADAASPAFKAFVANMHVNGVFQGSTPRVLIGSRTYEVGEAVNQDLGIVFTGIDPARKLVLFKDSTGVTLVKKY